MKLQHHAVLHCVLLFPFHTFSGSSAVKRRSSTHTHTHTHTHKSTKQNCVSLLGEQNGGTMKMKVSLKFLIIQQDATSK